ncbi:MAG: hypothetical protein HYV41_02030 [Candidatus Magasanikbacteria bacterium]|nr:hypothetical protein [Candidatus Magasanikbacteria bacterium]
MSLVLKTMSQDVSGFKDDVFTLKEGVEFLMENAVNKDEFNQAISSLENRMEDGFVNTQAQITQVEQELTQIKNEIRKLELRTREDSDAHVEDMIHLTRRVSYLETQVKFLQRQTI